MATERKTSAGRILVYRLGSIGDFAISLPALHLVRRSLPQAEIRLLTNRPVDARAAPAMSPLNGAGLIDGSIIYAIGTRDPRALLAVRRATRSFNPDLLVYLVPFRGFYELVRDYFFFRWCGVNRMIGLPLPRELRQIRRPAGGSGLWDQEAQRLERYFSELGPAGAERLENYDLRLSEAELAEADRRLAEGGIDIGGAHRILGLSIGTKQPAKDWGATIGAPSWKASTSATTALSSSARSKSGSGPRIWQGTGPARCLISAEACRRGSARRSSGVRFFSFATTAALCILRPRSAPDVLPCSARRILPECGSR